jgi:hypothetical protein
VKPLLRLLHRPLEDALTDRAGVDSPRRFDEATIILGDISSTKGGKLSLWLSRELNSNHYRITLQRFIS